MHDLTISQLARAASVRVETIRYYERLGLLRQPQRSENGYRQYTTGDAAQLQFIRNTQALGFTLKEIKQLINARQDNNACCTAVRAMTISPPKSAPSSSFSTSWPTFGKNYINLKPSNHGCDISATVAANPITASAAH